MPSGPAITAMTWTEFDTERKHTNFLVLPVGSVEQHGPHLPLGADSIVATEFAHRVAERHAGLVLPPISVGVLHRYRDWPGSLAVPPTLLHDLVVAVGRGAARWHDRLMILNGHDENHEILVSAARELTGELDVVVLEWAHVAVDLITRIGSSTSESHAGELLTSLLLHWMPESVRVESIVDSAPAAAGHTADDLHVAARAVRPVLVEPGGSGVQGTPSLGTAGKGRRIEDAVLGRLTELLAELGWDGRDKENGHA